MLRLEELHVIEILYKQGHSKKAISRQLGISVNTVRKYIKTGEKPRYSSRESKPLKLDPYKEYIVKRLADAYPHWVPATVIYREIKILGYQGKYTQLKDYMLGLKRPKQESIIRFETEPGYQMQVDWAVFRRGKDRLSAFIATLGYSRASYVEFVTDEKLETLLRCHQNAFDYFGGIPFTILYDNMKTVIIERDAYGTGQHRFHSGLWDFAKHTGFTPKVCKPYRAQTKGKVERFIHYLKHSFYFPLLGQLNALGQRMDEETANYYVSKWLNEVANQRLHSTIGAVPFHRLQEERLKLQPLAPFYATAEAGIAKQTRLIDFEAFDNGPFQHDLQVYEQLFLSKEVMA